MKDRDFEIAIAEVNSILNVMSKDDVEKIPKKLLNYLKKENNKQYNIEIRPDIPLNEQGLNPETVNLLGLIYRNYWCEDKEKYDQILIENQKIYDDEQNEKYSVKFDIRKTNSEENNEIEYNNDNSANLPLDISNEKWYTKISIFISNIYSKIKNIFKF